MVHCTKRTSPVESTLLHSLCGNCWTSTASLRAQSSPPEAPAAQPTLGAAKTADAPQPITVVAGFGVAPPAAPDAAGQPTRAAAAAPGGRSVVPLSVDSPLAGDSPTARGREDKKRPPLYHRKVGHGPCGIFRCVGNHRPTNYMIVRLTPPMTALTFCLCLAQTLLVLDGVGNIHGQTQFVKLVLMLASLHLCIYVGRGHRGELRLRACSCASGPSTATASGQTATRTSSRRCSATT